jgi:2-polyprenyl-6-methoxyphenol hydroxylase-like FAD-dependent oxidoreductase
MMKKTFAIVGGGIGGLTLAIALQRKGYDVRVFENAAVVKPLGAGLVLAANAIKAFEKIGISEDVINAGKILKALCIKDQNGAVLSTSDAEKLTAKLGIVNTFAIHRADLHHVLLGHLKDGTVQLNKGCVNFLHDGEKVLLQFHDGSSALADYVIACDGIHSAIRKKLLPDTYPRYSGYTCWRAVVDNIPAGINMNETSESWGPGKRFGIVPLSNNRIYWFACVNARENDPKMRMKTKDDLVEIFSNFHFPVREILKNTNNKQLIWNDIIDIKPLNKFAFGKIVLMGDAAHATTPNMGQGACMAVEDAVIMVSCLDKFPAEEAFIEFEKRRISRTTKIVNQSWRIGKVAQLENRLLITFRNFALKHTPSAVLERQVNFIAGVSF